MAKSVAVDLGALLDVLDAERGARTCTSVRVYRPGVEPLDWHLLPEHRQCGGAAGLGAVPGAVSSRTCSASGADRVAARRSRSPVRRLRNRSRFARGGPDLLNADRGLLEEWNGHFDGLVRPFRHGFVLAVDDAAVDAGADRRCSVFVAGFRENNVLRGEDILDQCLRRHLAGYRWERLVNFCDACRQVALAELEEGPAGALRLLNP